MSKENALYVTGRVGEVEIEWLLDSGCTLRPVLEENDVKMRMADGSLLPNY